jgi:hypothetical protein
VQGTRLARAADGALATLHTGNLQEPAMARSHLSNDERVPDPAGVDAGPQSGAGGAGGEPKGARLEAGQHERPAAQGQQTGSPRREHSSDKAQPGYRARPAGRSGLGAQEDLASTIREPQGDGNYIATDHGDEPLRNG